MHVGCHCRAPCVYTHSPQKQFIVASSPNGMFLEMGRTQKTHVATRRTCTRALRRQQTELRMKPGPRSCEVATIPARVSTHDKTLIFLVFLFN